LVRKEKREDQPEDPDKKKNQQKKYDNERRHEYEGYPSRKELAHASLKMNMVFVAFAMATAIFKRCQHAVPILHLPTAWVAIFKNYAVPTN
jgi:hypothetical protein